ncbi:MAG: hypothetical protein H6773_02405 [Pseudomonadales bacterium]|nr:hypothetical protein [Pseudomonadales bacterium]
MNEPGGIPVQEQVDIDLIKVGETTDMSPAEKRIESAARKRQENKQKSAENRAKWRGRWEKVVKVKDAVVGAAKHVPETAGKIYDYAKDIPAKVDVKLAQIDDAIDKKTDAWAESLDGTVQWTEDTLGGKGEHFSATIKSAQEALKNAKSDAIDAIGQIDRDEYNRGEHAKATVRLEAAQAAVKALEASRDELARQGSKAKDRAPLTRALAGGLRRLRGV